MFDRMFWSPYNAGMFEDKSVLIIIPAYNEADSLPGVFADIDHYLPSARLLVVDDGSYDSTAEVASRSGAHHVLSLPSNLGIGGAVQTGLIFALRNGFERVVRMDGDGQHRAADIPDLMSALDEDADIVIGSRFVEGKEGYQSTSSRLAGIRILSALCYLLTGRRVRDLTSGFRGYNARALQRLAPSYPTDYPEPDEVVMAILSGLNVAECSVSMSRRDAGRSSIRGWWPVYYMVKVSLSMVMTWLRERRNQR
jgi:glycosyltransferase involved in cell wall biosynthesis